MATLTSSYQFLGRSSVMTSTNGKLSYYLLLYGKTSANQTTGIHTVTIKSVLASTSTSATYYSYTQAHNGIVNGSKAYEGTNKPSKAWELSNFTAGGVTYKTGTLLGEGSVNVDCTNGLAKDITLSCYYAFKSTADTYTPAKGTNRTVSVTATLSAIPRQATLLTAPNFSDGDNPTITYSNPSGDAVTSLEAGIFNDAGGQSYVPYREISKTGTTYTFYLTDAERENLYNAAQSNSVSVKFYIRTTIGGVTYLSDPLTRTFSINNANPKITASVVDINSKTVALTGDNGKLIKYYSNAQATMSADPQKGASIDESLYIIRNGSNSGYGASHTFENVESNVFTFSAEDSRGNVGSANVTLPMVEYTKLTCYIANNRPDALGNMTVACTGDYFNGSFGAEENTLTVQYRYGISGGTFGEWTDMSVTKYTDHYYASADFVIPDFEQTKSYAFETRAIDKLDTADNSSGAVKNMPIFHWGENDFVFEVPVTFNAGTNASLGEGDQDIDGNLNVTGNLRLKGDGNYGNALLFGDGTYCYISEPTDDVMHIKATRIDLNANSVYVYGNPIPTMQTGRWTPSLNSSAISYYTTQEGWYSKLGQTVSVGFFIKATCNSGYQGTNISITGLPFTPLFSAAGGGMCSKVYITGGYNFQCFVAETSGTITIRVQACNNTSTTSLATSASGCVYPSSGGEITLSGTITYFANS